MSPRHFDTTEHATPLRKTAATAARTTAGVATIVLTIAAAVILWPLLAAAWLAHSAISYRSSLRKAWASRRRVAGQ